MRGIHRPLPLWGDLRQYFDYDPHTGILVHLIGHRGAAPGTQAGRAISSGHIIVHCLGSGWLAHRVIWKWMTSIDPGESEVDHRNRVHSDNRWENLRLATLQQQNQNHPLRRDNSLGVRGVHQRGTRFRAQIRQGRRVVHLGYYASAEEAAEVYQEAARSIHGEFYAE